MQKLHVVFALTVNKKKMQKGCQQGGTKSLYEADPPPPPPLTSVLGMCCSGDVTDLKFESRTCTQSRALIVT